MRANRAVPAPEELQPTTSSKIARQARRVHHMIVMIASPAEAAHDLPHRRNGRGISTRAVLRQRVIRRAGARSATWNRIFGGTISGARSHVGLGHLLDERFDLGRDVVLNWVREQDFQRQKRRNPVRCQRTTVSGLTMTSTSAQARPQAGESEPEGPVNPSQARAGGGTPEVGEVLAKGDVFVSEVS